MSKIRGFGENPRLKKRSASMYFSPVALGMALSACGGGGSESQPRTYNTVLQRSDSQYTFTSTLPTLSIEDNLSPIIDVESVSPASDTIFVEFYASGLSSDVLVFDFADSGDTVVLAGNSVIKNFFGVEVVRGTVDFSQVDLPSSIQTVTINSQIIFSAVELKHVTAVNGTGEFVISLTNAAELQALQSNIANLHIDQGISAKVVNTISLSEDTASLLASASITVDNPELVRADEDDLDLIVDAEKTGLDAFLISTANDVGKTEVQFFVNWEELIGHVSSLESFDFKLLFDTNDLTYLGTDYSGEEFMVAINSVDAATTGEVAISGFSLNLLNGFTSDIHSFISNDFDIDTQTNNDVVEIQITDIFVNGVSYQDISYEFV